MTAGAVLDRSQGNTGGLGGRYGVFYALGRPSIPALTRPLRCVFLYVGMYKCMYRRMVVGGGGGREGLTYIPYIYMRKPPQVPVGGRVEGGAPPELRHARRRQGTS